MSEPTTIKLTQPIEFGEETIEELRFRQPRAKDFRKLPMLDGYLMDTILILAGRLAGQPNAVIDKIEGDDLTEVIELVSGFMPGGPQTGSEDSPS